MEEKGLLISKKSLSVPEALAILQAPPNNVITLKEAQKNQCAHASGGSGGGGGGSDVRIYSYNRKSVVSLV